MEYLERNMSRLDNNIKMDIKETIFVFRLISLLDTALSKMFGKDNEVILHKKFKYIQKFWNWAFLRTHSDQPFLFIA
jgi:hypothetical protein